MPPPPPPPLRPPQAATRSLLPPVAQPPRSSVHLDPRSLSAARRALLASCVVWRSSICRQRLELGCQGFGSPIPPYKTSSRPSVSGPSNQSLQTVASRKCRRSMRAAMRCLQILSRGTVTGIASQARLPEGALGGEQAEGDAALEEDGAGCPRSLRDCGCRGIDLRGPGRRVGVGLRCRREGGGAQGA